MVGSCAVHVTNEVVFGLVLFQNIERLHFYAIPVLLVCVFAFLIAHCFLSIYEVSLPFSQLPSCQVWRIP